MARLLVGLSGGVDSSVAAALLVRDGHEVEGAYMKNWINEDRITGNCPWEEDLADARKVAAQIGIPFRVVNMIRDYRDRVVDYLLQGYQDGITPNPDVLCNREMKFGVFLRCALEEGFDGVATGHYARRVGQDGGRGGWRLARGRDRTKDQSYFLALLRADQVQRAWFPLGDLMKKQVREAAAGLGLATAAKKDSQGICFIGQVRMRDFLRAYVPDDPGEVVTTDGEVVGTHQGLHLYTLGQRKGHGVASPRHGVAYVVVAKDFRSKRLVVGYDDPATPGLYAREAVLGGVSWAGPGLDPGCHRVRAQPRYRTEAPWATVEVARDGTAGLCYDEPQRALAPGQICALYDGDDEVLLGGAVFQSIRAGAAGG